MPAKIDAHAREEGTFVISLTFTDEDDNGVVCDSLNWTLSDMDGNVLNGRSAVSITPSATTESIVLSGTDLTMISGQTHMRMITLQWTYSSTYGTNLPQNDQATFIIDDLLHVT